MIRHVWSLVCLKTIVDEKTKIVNLLDVVDKMIISVPKNILKRGEVTNNPIRFGPILLVSQWTFSNSKNDESSLGRIEMVDPTGKIKNSPEILLEKEQKRNLRTTVEITLGVRIPGIYSFNVEKKDSTSNKWIQQASIPLEIVFDIIPSSKKKRKKSKSKEAP